MRLQHPPQQTLVKTLHWRRFWRLRNCWGRWKIMKTPARSQKRFTKVTPPGFKTTTATASTWASYTTRGLPKRGRCEVGEIEQGNDGICLLAVDAGAHVSEPASRPSHWHDVRVKHYSRSCVFPQRPAGPLATQYSRSPRFQERALSLAEHLEIAGKAPRGRSRSLAY
jgi:hypothetical protein